MNTIISRLLLVFILALMLTIVPLPNLLTGLRPAWVLIVLLYIQFYLPNTFSIVLVVFVGLLLDVLLATIIGEHAFALIIVTWIASNKSKRFYFFTMSQQMALMAFLILTYQLLILIIDAFAGFSISLLSCLTTTVLTVLIWPWIRLLGQELLLTKVRYQK